MTTWDDHAGWWRDQFTAGADPEYEEQILPLVRAHLRDAGRVLEVGCGEGQVCRAAASAGNTVVGVDPTWPLVSLAHERAGGPTYARGDALALPFPDASFDAVLACLVFEHLPDHEGPIAEVARVLRPGGTFLFLLNHPLLQTPDSGWIDDHILEEQYWRIGHYLRVDTTLETLAPGVTLPFVHRPLHHYVNALSARGLLVEHMDEPAPPPGFVARAPEYEEAATIPRLLVLRTRKQPSVEQPPAEAPIR